MPKPSLLVATHNPGKMREYRELLEDSPYDLVSLDDLGISLDVDETGTTFFENAWLKAHAYAAEGGLLTLADDSGLEVDALRGEPGIHSARYGGDACKSDDDRVNLLLLNLNGVPWERRTARFRCVIAIAHPPGSGAPASNVPDITPARSSGTNVACVVGSVAGMIQYVPAGDEGFGYDPVFHLPSYGRTIAQLPLREKNRISHRSDAARRAVQALKRSAAGVH
jgi:XTP/dITP diphosphohydrolase